MDVLGNDFSAVRAALLPGDARQLVDMRRSGAVEGDGDGDGDGGEATVADQSNKMASTRLRKTCNKFIMPIQKLNKQTKALSALLSCASSTKLSTAAKLNLMSIIASETISETTPEIEAIKSNAT